MAFLGARDRVSLFADDSGLDKIQKPPVPGPNTQWVGGFMVGSGSYGVVSTWVLVDKETSKPINNVVIKDTFLNKYESTEERGLYKGIYRQLVQKGLDFGADLNERVGHARPEHRFLKEAYLHGLLTEPDSNQDFYTVPLWGYARKKTTHFQHNHWRLYMPLYDCGDLEALVKAHCRKKRPIPEPFIWHTLECLMHAAVLMEQKARTRPGNTTHTDVVVVFDMKLENILLASPDQTKSFPIYPRPHVADLGGSCLTSAYDRSNIRNVQEFQMTYGWIAPEMWRPEDIRGDHKSEPILPDTTLRGSCTNVWQIGRVAEQMMKLDTRPEYTEYHSDFSEEDMEPVIHKDEDEGDFPEKRYSEALRDLVRHCLRLDPERRPTPTRVLNDISRSGPQYYQGMDTFGSDDWMEVIQQEIDETPPEAAEETPDQEAILTKIEAARPYLRAWDIKKTGRFVDLARFPPDDMLLERNDKGWWATDPDDPIIDEEGKPLRKLPYEWCPWEKKNVLPGHNCPMAATLAAQALGGSSALGPPVLGPPIPGPNAFGPPTPGPNAFELPPFSPTAVTPVVSDGPALSFEPFSFEFSQPIATPLLPPPASGSTVGGVELGFGYGYEAAQTAPTPPPAALRVVNPDAPEPEEDLDAPMVDV